MEKLENLIELMGEAVAQKIEQEIKKNYSKGDLKIVIKRLNIGNINIKVKR